MRRSLILSLVAVLAAGGSAVYLASSADAAVACAPAWSATAVYVGGNQASQSGHNYTAKWWTQNESPATHSGQWDVWADNGVCGGGTTPPTTPPPTTANPTTPPPTTPPPTTPPPTTPPPTTGIPKHALIGYLHASFANGSGYLRMADVPADWDIIDLAFGEPTSPTSGDIRFTLCPASECPGVESEADFTAAIRAKRAAGKKVLLSIGGANGQVQLTTTATRCR
jgi:chitinase